MRSKESYAIEIDTAASLKIWPQVGFAGFGT